MHGTEARVVGFPGDTSIGPGATLTFRMEMPCDFVGRRLVIQAIDTANGSDHLIFLRSITHDNKEMLANGRTALIPSVCFAPPVWRYEIVATGSSATAPDNAAPFHEQFYTGESFTVTVFNQTANNTQMVMYWITDYGEKCGCPNRGR